MDTVKEVRKLLSSLKKNFQCTICLDFLYQPVSTKCNHQFCSGCLQEFIKSNVKGKKPCCPLCNSDLGTKRSLNPNPELSKIITAVKDVCNAADKDCTNLDVSPLLSQKHRTFSAKKSDKMTSTKNNRKSLKFTSATSKKFINEHRYLQHDDIIETDFIKPEKMNKPNKCRLKNKEEKRKKIKTSSNSSDSLEHEVNGDNTLYQNSFKRRKIISSECFASVSPENHFSPPLPFSNETLIVSDEILVEQFPKNNFEYIKSKKNNSSSLKPNLFLEDSLNTSNCSRINEPVQPEMTLIDDDATEDASPQQNSLKETSLLRKTQLSCDKENVSPQLNSGSLKETLLLKKTQLSREKENVSPQQNSGSLKETSLLRQTQLFCEKESVSPQQNSDKLKETSLLRLTQLSCEKEKSQLNEVCDYELAEIDRTNNKTKCDSPKSKINGITSSDSIFYANDFDNSISSPELHSPKMKVKKTVEQCEPITPKSNKKSLLRNDAFLNELSLKKVLAENISNSLENKLANSPESVVSTCFQNSLANNFSFFLKKIESPNKDKTLLGNCSFSKIDLSTRKNWYPLKLCGVKGGSNGIECDNNNITLDSFGNSKHLEEKHSDNKHSKNNHSDNKQNENECNNCVQDHVNKHENSQENLLKKFNSTQESCLSGGENYLRKRKRKKRKIYARENLKPENFEKKHSLTADKKYLLQNENLDYNKKENSVVAIGNELTLQNAYSEELIPPTPNMSLCGMQFKSEIIKQTVLCENEVESDDYLNLDHLDHTDQKDHLYHTDREDHFLNSFPQVSSQLLLDQIKQSKLEIPLNNEQCDIQLEIEENKETSKLSIKIEDKLAGSINLKTDETIKNISPKQNNEIYNKKNNVENEHKKSPCDLQIFGNDSSLNTMKGVVAIKPTLVVETAGPFHQSDESLNSPATECLQQRANESFLISDDIFCYDDIDIYTNEKKNTFSSKAKVENTGSIGNDTVEKIYAPDRFLSCSEDKIVQKCEETCTDNEVINFLEKQFNEPIASEVVDQIDFHISERNVSNAKPNETNELGETRNLVHSPVEYLSIQSFYNLADNKMTVDNKQQNLEKDAVIKKSKKIRLKNDMKNIEELLNESDQESNEKYLKKKKSKKQSTETQSERRRAKQRLKKKKLLKQLKLIFTKIIVASSSSSSSSSDNEEVDDEDFFGMKKIVNKTPAIHLGTTPAVHIGTTSAIHLEEKNLSSSPSPPLSPSSSSPPKSLMKSKIVSTYIDNLKQKLLAKPEEDSDEYSDTTSDTLPHVTEDVVETFLKKSPHATNDVVKTFHKKLPHATEEIGKIFPKKRKVFAISIGSRCGNNIANKHAVEKFLEKLPHAIEDEQEIFKKSPEKVSTLDNSKSGFFNTTKDQLNIVIPKKTFLEKVNEKGSENKSIEIGNFDTTCVQEENYKKNIKDLSPNTPLRSKIKPVHQSTALRQYNCEIANIKPFNPPKKLSSLMQPNQDDYEKPVYTHNIYSNQFIKPAEVTKPSLIDSKLNESLANNDNVQELKSPSIVLSRLTKKQTGFCDLLCQKLNAKMNQDFSDDVTHLVIGTDEANFLLKTSYTFKYLMALVSGIWIVSFHWVIQCLKNSKFVEEDSFEVKGDPSEGHGEIPAQYRIAKKKKSLLLTGYCIWIQGTFQRSPIKKDQLVLLLKKLGAEMLFSLEEDVIYDKYIKLIMITDNLSEISAHENSLMIQYGLKPIHPEWLVQSVINFRVANETDWIVQD